MNKEILSAFQSKSIDDLFYYFKHDGAMDFEKKIIAGKLLKEKSYDIRVLAQEKSIIENELQNRIKESESKEGIQHRAAKKLNRKLFFGLGYFSIFLFLGLKDYWYKQEELDWVYLSIMLSLALILIIYHFVTYQKKLGQLIKAEMENNELLRFRLKLIEEHWIF